MAHRFRFYTLVDLEDLGHQEDPEDKYRKINPMSAQSKLKRHIKDSVQSWGGQFYPHHVLFSQNIIRVTVKDLP